MPDRILKKDTQPINSQIILVVDDNQGFLSSICDNLEDEGYQVVQALNGAEALEVFNRLTPSLILMDIRMPVMDGFDACQRIRQLSDGYPIPIIFMTAFDEESSIEQAFAAGATDYVVKPIRWPVLNARIQNLLKTQTAEQRFSALAESATDGIITIDQQGVILYTNPAANKIFGYEANELLGQALEILMPDEFRNKHRKNLQHYIQTRLPKIIGKTIGLLAIRKNGQRFPIELSLSMTEFSGELSFTGVLRDITERAQNEKQIEESQARYQHIFETAGVSLWVEDFSQVKVAIEELKTQGIADFRAYMDAHPKFLAEMARSIKIVDVNQTTLQMLKAESKDVLIGQLQKVFTLETLEIVRDEIIAIANGRTYFEGETINRTLQGQVINVLITIVFPKDAEQFNEVLVSAIEITDRVLLEKETKQRADLMSQLAQIGEALNRSFSETQAIEIIGESGMALSGVDRAAIFEIDTNSTVSCLWFHNISPEHIEAAVTQFEDLPGGKFISQIDPVLIEDINILPEESPGSKLAKQEGFQAVGLWPLVYEDRTVAIFASYHLLPHTWLPAEQEVLLAFSRQAAVALENTRLIQKEQQRRQELARLYRASEALQSSTKPDLAQLAQSIVETVLREFNQSNCSLILVRPDQQELQRIAVAGSFANEVSKGQLFKDGPGLVPTAIANGEIVNIPDVSNNPDYLPHWGNAGSEIAIPLKIGSHVIGAIDLQSAENDAFSEDDERLLSSFANRAALAITNANLFAETQNQTMELVSLNDQLWALNVTLEERVRQRTYELQVLHELSQEISYTLDYEELFRRMLAHLHRIVDYDVAMSLLYENDQPRLYQRLNRRLAPATEAAIQSQLITTFERMYHGQPINWDQLTIHTLDRESSDLSESAFLDDELDQNLGSVFQVPLIMQSNQQIVGLLFVGAEKVAAFSEDSVRLLYTLATQASISLERLRSLMDVEQQRLESLVERVPEGIILLNQRKNIVLDNPAGRRYLERLATLSAEQTLTHLGSQEIEHYLHPREDGLPHEITIDHGGHQIFEVASRPIDSGPETGGWALTLWDVTWERDLLATEKTRRRELDALYGLSRELATTDNLNDVLQTIAKHSVESVRITFSRVLLAKNNEFRCWSAYPIRAFQGDLGVNHLEDEFLWPAYQQVLSANQPQIYSSDDCSLPQEVCVGLMRDIAQSICLIPLRIGNESIGILVLGESRDENREPFDAYKLRLASAIGDQAASAIHRATLHQQTRQRLDRLAALRQIDVAITSSVDLRITLSVLLDQIRQQLTVDAADVLLLNPYLHTLEYVYGLGFRTNRMKSLVARLDVGYAGQVVLTRETVHIADINENLPDDDLAVIISGEEFHTYFGVPLIAKGNIKGVLEIYHRSALRPDEDWLNFLQTLAGQTAIAIDNSEMFENLTRSNLELRMAYDATIEGWARTLEYRDMETEGHSRRVVDLTIKLANSMGVQRDELVKIRRGALLHDIGKMGIPDNILRKPGPLDDEEWKLMRQHPLFAYEMLKPIDFLHGALDIPYSHHERWDGTGYPQGLRGTQIPQSARIFAIVDVWDALNTDRPYRKAWPKERIIAHLQEQSGTHFDPQVVDAFISLLQNSEK